MGMYPAVYLQSFTKLLNAQLAQLWRSSMQCSICHWHRLGQDLPSCRAEGLRVAERRHSALL